MWIAVICTTLVVLNYGSRVDCLLTTAVSPTAVTVSVNTTATFDCTPNSSSTFRWQFVDQQTNLALIIYGDVKMNPRFSVKKAQTQGVSIGALTITPVHQSDAGIYQCTENRHIISSYWLTVLDGHHVSTDVPTVANDDGKTTPSTVLFGSDDVVLVAIAGGCMLLTISTSLFVVFYIKKRRCSASTRPDHEPDLVSAAPENDPRPDDQSTVDVAGVTGTENQDQQPTHHARGADDYYIYAEVQPQQGQQRHRMMNTNSQL